MKATDLIDNDQLRDDVPDFAPGDEVKVHVRVVEGSKERIQVFQGNVIARQGGGLQETYTVRKLSYGVGVERTFPLHTPTVTKIEVVKRGDVRRAKLYYLRGRTGKAAKIREKRSLLIGRPMRAAPVECTALPCRVRAEGVAMVAAHIEYGQRGEALAGRLVSTRTATRSSAATGAARSGRSTSSRDAAACSSSPRSRPGGAMPSACRRSPSAPPSSNACAVSPRRGWSSIALAGGCRVRFDVVADHRRPRSTSTRTPSDQPMGVQVTVPSPRHPSVVVQPATAQTSRATATSRHTATEHVVERAGAEAPVRVVAHAVSIAGVPADAAPTAGLRWRPWSGDSRQLVVAPSACSPGRRSPPPRRNRPRQDANRSSTSRSAARSSRCPTSCSSAPPSTPTTAPCASASTRCAPATSVSSPRRASSTSATASTPSTSTRATST